MTSISIYILSQMGLVKVKFCLTDFSKLIEVEFSLPAVGGRDTVILLYIIYILPNRDCTVPIRW